MFDKVTKVAALVPVCAAIYFTCRGFMGLGMGLELVAILTLLMASLSWMLSQALLRGLEVRDTRYMKAAVIALGVAFLIAETFFAHLGLEWMLQQGEGIEAPALVVWFFSAALSVTNVLAKWAFLHTPEASERDEAIRQADNVVQLDLPMQYDEVDLCTIEKIRARVGA